MGDGLEADSPYAAIGPAEGGELDPVDWLGESDATLYHRARQAGWTPGPEHCPPDTSRLAGDWRESARSHLARNLQ